MNSSTKKILRISVPLLLAVFFGWYTFSKLPIAEIIPYFKSANFSWIALGVFLGFLSHLSRGYRWKFMLEPMGYHIKLPNSLMAVFITYLANYGIPRSGEILRAAVLTNYEGVPFEKAFGTIVAERVADLIVIFGIITMTLILQFDFIYSLLEESFQPIKIIIGGVIIILLIFFLFFVLRKSNSKIAIKIKAFLSGLMEGIMSIFRMKQKWAFIFHTLFIWGMYVLMFYVTTFALKDLEGISIGAILIAFIAASFTIAATNGGIFVYPLAIMAAFTLFDIAEAPSLAFGWIMWTSQTIMLILFGSFSFLFLPIYNRKKSLEK